MPRGAEERGPPKPDGERSAAKDACVFEGPMHELKGGATKTIVNRGTAALTVWLKV